MDFTYFHNYVEDRKLKNTIYFQIFIIIKKVHVKYKLFVL